MSSALRRLATLLVLALTLTACAATYDLATPTTLAELEAALEGAEVELTIESTFVADREDGDLVSIDGTGDADLAAVGADALAGGLTVVVVDNSVVPLPDLSGLKPDEVEGAVQAALGDFAPNVVVRELFEPGLAVGEVAVTDADGEPIAAGDPIEDSRIFVETGTTRDLVVVVDLRIGDDVLGATPEAAIAPDGSEFTSTSWTERDDSWEGAPCFGTGIADTIAAGVELTITTDGVEHATATFDPGFAYLIPGGSGSVTWGCEVVAVFSDVPALASFEIQDGSDQPLPVTFEELELIDGDAVLLVEVHV